MRIVIVRDPPAERSPSMDRYADELNRWLSDDGRWSVSQLGLRFRSYPAGPATRVGRQFDRLVRLPVGAARRSADLFHIIDQGYAHAAALLPPERTVITCHDLMLLRSAEGVTGFRGGFASRARFRWSVSHLKRVAHVICDSETTREDVLRLCEVDPRRASVIAPGVGSHFMVSERRAELRAAWAEPGEILVLNVSSGPEYKNIEGVLRTVAALRDQGHRPILLRIGVLLTEAQQRLAERLGVAGCVREAGRVPERALVEAYQASDVLLHPSHWEGFGWPALEAMACGTPVVVSTTPTLAEVVGDAAELAPADDVEALAACVLRATRDERRREELIGLGVERSRRFGWPATAAQVSAVYDEVLARCAGAAA